MGVFRQKPDVFKVKQVYCLVTQRWTDLFIFFVVGAAVIGILFLVVILGNPRKRKEARRPEKRKEVND